jgi:ubiquinone/menaquinone biosynthesis C-methylase UbiE
MVDMKDADPALLKGELRNLRIINRRFGGISSVQQALIPMSGLSETSHTITILDLATGSADQAVEIVRTFRRLGRGVCITAVDNNDAVLADARGHAAGFDEIRFENRDIRTLTYPDRSFDIVLCSLALHHFSRTDAVGIIREMNRISKIGFILNDLSRSYPGLACAWIYTRATTTNIMTKTDAIMSVRAAFTKTELEEMIREAGVGAFGISRAPFFRLMGIHRKKDLSGGVSASG